MSVSAACSLSLACKHAVLRRHLCLCCFACGCPARKAIIAVLETMLSQISNVHSGFMPCHMLCLVHVE